MGNGMPVAANKNTDIPSWELSDRDGRGAVSLRGNWTVAYLDALFEEIQHAENKKVGAVSINAKDLTAFDTAGVLALKHLIEKLGATESTTFVGLKPEHKQLIELVQAKSQAGEEKESAPKENFLSRIGRLSIEITDELLGIVSLLGETVVALGRQLRSLKRFRLTELFVQLEDSFVNAIPVLSLVMMLIGVVLAYLFGDQSEKYGASIFVVDAVTVAVIRELSPVIVSVIIAGRSGSAFTAQLGSMVLNEEVDAIRTLGLSLIEVLVIPRVLALVLTMPLLVFVGDIVGVLGGLFVSNVQLGLHPDVFFNRILEIHPVASMQVGLVKAPVFALFIGLIACRNGFRVERNARSVGEFTTKTVVQSIVAVILLDAMFAVVFRHVGY